MNTKKFLIYKEYDIPLIEIEKDDFQDKQGLSDRLIQEINKISKGRFNFSNFIRFF